MIPFYYKLFLQPNDIKQKIYHNFDSNTNELTSYILINNQIILHSENDFPAYIYMNGIKIERWYKFDSLYRKNGPSTIITYTDGTKECIWKNIVNNEIEEIDRPTIVSYRKDKSIKYIVWMKDDIEHKDGIEPSYISYYKNGDLKTVRKKINGQLCSINDEPSLIKYKDNKIEKYWHFNDKIHRRKFPAVIKYEDNTKEFEYWYLDKKLMTIKF